MSIQNGLREAENEIKKNLVLNSVHSKPGQENSEKSCRKIQKTKKPHFGVIFSQNGMRQAEKARKKFQFRIPFILDPGKKIPKKIAKKFEKLKTSFRHYFQPKRDGIGREREKKKLDPNFVPTQPELENSKKK